MLALQNKCLPRPKKKGLQAFVVAFETGDCTNKTSPDCF